MLFVDNEGPGGVKPSGHFLLKGHPLRRAAAKPLKNGLSKQQLDAIKLLASGCTARYTALVLNINFSEVNKWMTQDEQFKDAVAEQIKNLQSNQSSEMAKPKSTKKGAQAAPDTKRPSG